MKNALIFAVLGVVLGTGLQALDRSGLAGTLSIGIGAEMNQYTDFASVALGEMIHAGYAFRPDMAVGARVLFSQNFGDYYNFVPAGFFRWYPFALGPVLFFLQAEAGGIIILADDGWSNAAFDGGGSLGARIPLGLFYVEAYARYCYPGGFAFGAAGGLALKLKK